MAKVLCVTSGLRGLLNTSIELLSRLEQDGHTTLYACGHDVGDYVEAHGLRYHQLPPVNFSPAPEEPNGTGGRLRSLMAQWQSAKRRRAIGVQQLNMQAFIELLRNESPDLVLLDAEVYEHIFAAWAEDLNIALITPFFVTHPQPGAPPLQSDIVPGVGFKGSSIGLKLSWWRVRLTKAWKRFLISLRYTYTDRRSVLLDYARQQGYPVSHLSQSTWVTLFNDRFLPTLSLNAAELDFEHTLRPQCNYVGPMIADQRKDPAIEDDTLKALERLYARRRSEPVTLLYSAVSTMQLKESAWVKKLVAAVNSRPDWLLILSGIDPQSLPPADNVFAFKSAPQLDILNHADLCIMQGGVNTLNECVLKQVPVIMYPHDVADQHGCTARATFHGVARRGSRADSPSAIVDAVEKTLNDSALRTNQAQFSAYLESYKDKGILQNVVKHLIDYPTKKSLSKHT